MTLNTVIKSKRFIICIAFLFLVLRVAGEKIRKSGQPARFLLHEMPKTGDVLFLEHQKTPNLTSDSDSPSFICPKTGKNRFFITWECRKPAMFYFWNIKKRRYSESDTGTGFPVPHLPIFDPSFALLLFLVPITHILCKTPYFSNLFFGNIPTSGSISYYGCGFT